MIPKFRLPLTYTEILFGENATVAVGVTIAKISTSGGIVKPKQLVQEQEQEQEPVKIRRASKGKKKVYEYFQPKRTDWYIKQVLLAFGFEYRSSEGISMSEIEAIAGSGIGGRLSKTIFSVIFKTERAEVFHLLLQNLFLLLRPQRKEIHPDKEKKLFRWTIYVSELCIT